MRNGPTVSRVPMELVIFDEHLQTRKKFNTDHIEEFRTWLLEHPDEDMEPVQAVLCDGEYICWDGWHRGQAYDGAERLTIPVAWRPGTKREATLLAAGANARHGLKRSDDDKRKAVGILLNDPEWSAWSDRAIADACGVSHTFVGQERSLLATDSNRETRPRERVTRSDGVEMKNPAATKLKLAEPPEDEDDDGDETPVDDANAILENAEDWYGEANSVLGAWPAARPHLDVIWNAIAQLRRVVTHRAS